MIHYHGTPITPNAVLSQLAGCNFCVSYFRPDQVALVHELGQSVMLDNGAYSFWRKGLKPDWDGYAEWAARWLEHRTTWAVIPDVIDGSEMENDRLIAAWPRELYKQSAPVWHLHESLERLTRLCVGWPRVCIGSSGAYAVVGDARWHRRMEQVMNVVCGVGPGESAPAPVWLHMLRGMNLAGSEYPFASVDSTDVGTNHNRGGDVLARAVRWDQRQCPARWEFREQLAMC